MVQCTTVVNVPTDELLTSPQAGLILGKSGRTMQRAADSGALIPTQKLPGPNGHYLWSRKYIESVAARHAEDIPA